MNKPIVKRFCLFNLLLLPFMLLDPSEELKKALKDLTFLNQYNLQNAAAIVLPAVVKGSIKKRSGLEVEADVTLYRDTALSENIYGYAFQFTPTPGDFSLCIRRDHDHLNGISTSDIAKIQRHILGIESFSHPYLLLAADVNKTKSLTAADVAEIRKLVLGIIPRFSKVPSWVFVPLDTTYGTALPGVDFFANYCNRFKVETNTLINVDYAAIKMGDVTENAKGVNFTQTESRNQNTNLLYQSANLNDGTIRTDFKLNSEISLSGIQFTLAFDSNELEFDKIENGEIQIEAEHFSLHDSDKGKIHVAWTNNPLKNTYSNSGTLFTIVWKKKTNTIISPVLKFDPSGVPSLTVDRDLNEIDLKLQNSDQIRSVNISVYQNINNQTISITAEVLQETNANYTIINAQGHVIHQNSLILTPGSFYKNISLDFLPANTIYFIKIQTSNSSQTWKMIRL